MSEEVKRVTLPIGTELEHRYQVTKVIGSGGFGITYEAFDTKLQRKVAVKECFPDGFTQLERDGNNVQWYIPKEGLKYRRKVLKEGRRLAQATNLSATVDVLDIFGGNNTAYIVMHFVEGENLKHYRERHGSISLSDCVTLLTPIMQDLGELHKQNLIHCDISPDNIILQSNGKSKLIDFGSVKELDGEGELLTKTVTVKSAFSPPEQIATCNIGSWSDVFSMCKTIWYCMIGNSFVKLQDKAPDVLKEGFDLDFHHRIQTMDELLLKLNRETAPPRAEISFVDRLFTRPDVIQELEDALEHKEEEYQRIEDLMKQERSARLDAERKLTAERTHRSQQERKNTTLRQTIEQMSNTEREYQAKLEEVTAERDLEKVAHAILSNSLKSERAKREELEDKRKQLEEALQRKGEEYQRIEDLMKQERSTRQDAERKCKQLEEALQRKGEEYQRIEDLMKQERSTRQDAERKRAEELARQEAELKRKEKLARQETERKRKEELARQEAERKRKEELARQEAERKRKETLIDSGSCDKNVRWELDNKYVLHIIGSGTMDNYNSANTAPWLKYNYQIKGIVIANGITAVGGFAFKDCGILTSVVIPNSVTAIGKRAFYGCSSLTSVIIPNSVTTIGESTFSNCSSLTSVEIPNSVITIDEWAFSWCYSLRDIYYKGNHSDWNKITVDAFNYSLTHATIHYNSRME